MAFLPRSQRSHLSFFLFPARRKLLAELFKLALIFVCARGELGWQDLLKIGIDLQAHLDRLSLQLWPSFHRLLVFNVPPYWLERVFAAQRMREICNN